MLNIRHVWENLRKTLISGALGIKALESQWTSEKHTAVRSHWVTPAVTRCCCVLTWSITRPQHNPPCTDSCSTGTANVPLQRVWVYSGSKHRGAADFTHLKTRVTCRVIYSYPTDLSKNSIKV